MKFPGLGDLAYYAFRPAVYVIDAVWGTDMRHCQVCKARRARWNAAPFSRVISLFVVTILIAATIYTLR